MGFVALLIVDQRLAGYFPNNEVRCAPQGEHFDFLIWSATAGKGTGTKKTRQC